MAGRGGKASTVSGQKPGVSGPWNTLQHPPGDPGDTGWAMDSGLRAQLLTPIPAPSSSTHAPLRGAAGSGGSPPPAGPGCTAVVQGSPGDPGPTPQEGCGAPGVQDREAPLWPHSQGTKRFGTWELQVERSGSPLGRAVLGCLRLGGVGLCGERPGVDLRKQNEKPGVQESSRRGESNWQAVRGWAETGSPNIGPAPLLPAVQAPWSVPSGEGAKVEAAQGAALWGGLRPSSSPPPHPLARSCRWAARPASTPQGWVRGWFVFSYESPRAGHSQGGCPGPHATSWQECVWGAGPQGRGPCPPPDPFLRLAFELRSCLISTQKRN